MNKKYFTFLESFWETAQALPEEMQVGAMNAIVKYGLYGELPEDPIMLAIVTALKAPIDDGNEIREKRREAGSKPKQKEANGNKTEQKETKASKMEQTETNGNKEKEKAKETEKKNNKDLMSSAASVLDALNRETGRHFKPTEGTLKPIMARLREERTVEECLEIIRKQVKAWKDDKRMSGYLRPETLFSSSHFDSYLNAPEPESIDRSERPPNRFHNFEERKTDYDAMLGVI